MGSSSMGKTLGGSQWAYGEDLEGQSVGLWGRPCGAVSGPMGKTLRGSQWAYGEDLEGQSVGLWGRPVLHQFWVPAESEFEERMCAALCLHSVL